MSSKKNRQAAARAVLTAASKEALQTAGITQPVEGLVPTQSLASEAQVETASTTAGPAVPASGKARRPAGLGHPEARKLINPQHTLEMKKAAARKLGGTMVYQNKNWIIHVPSGEFKIPSRTLAGFSLASFILEISQPKKPGVVNPTPNAEVKTDSEAQVEDEAKTTAEAA
jgi:hypothetical protein